MAEERLIDDDKDRKYKIRKNADGEDELIIDTSVKVEEEEVTFEVPDLESDDEEAAIMTPEQLAARQKAREEEEERRANKVAALIERAQTALGIEDYEGAIYALSEAEELDEKNGEVGILKLKALSKSFTDFTRSAECALAADGVKEYATAEQKAELAGYAAAVEAKIKPLKEEVKSLGEENERKKGERREVFKARRKNAIVWFCATVLPFIAFLVVAISFSTMMHAQKNYTNQIITIVFAALAAACFIATVFTAHKLWESVRNVKINERNSSTGLGREYTAKSTLLEHLTRIYAAINGVEAENDIS